ncbi:hypothetical protein LCGC14_0315800 [marine sediment metagenome]|uniref:Uncharacterized protein n=1 Tax=marine sediment metagenome TaxID=412755 RepID=A0A0F9TR68_9ZZZZ|nr:hypothetical protein [Phycisphaerae bacterium]HDZ44134.1 hypothetical protein [Phycisphaerae bacterium]
MLIEHVFVTTLEKDQAFALAAEMLHRSGFLATASGPDALNAECGGRAPGNPSRCPQRVHLVFDRGRVTVAAGITLRNGSDKVKPLHKQMMLSLVDGFDELLVKQVDIDRALAGWRVVHDEIARRRRRITRVSIGCLSLLLALVAACIVFVWIELS